MKVCLSNSDNTPTKAPWYRTIYPPYLKQQKGHIEAPYLSFVILTPPGSLSNFSLQNISVINFDKNARQHLNVDKI